VVDYRKSDCYGKGLSIEYGESVDDVVGDTDQGAEYDVQEDGEEELVQGNEVPFFIVPHKSKGDD
jgi:hypothetical protein